RVFDDADCRAIALVRAANTAWLHVGDVAAYRAEMDGLLHVQDRFGQVRDGVWRLAQQVKRQPLRGLGANARQRGERLDGAGDRLNVHEWSVVSCQWALVMACRGASCRR